jgi:hypothetical protein
MAFVARAGDRRPRRMERVELDLVDRSFGILVEIYSSLWKVAQIE